MKKTLHNTSLSIRLASSLLALLPAALFAQDRWNDGIYSTPYIRTIKSPATETKSNDPRIIIPYGSDIKVSRTNNLPSLPGQANFNVFPNPAMADTRVVFSSRETGLTYHLYMVSMDGKPLLQKSGTTITGVNTVNLDMSSYPMGTYLLQLIIADRKEMIRLVKAVR